MKRWVLAKSSLRALHCVVQRQYRRVPATATSKSVIAHMAADQRCISVLRVVSSVWDGSCLDASRFAIIISRITSNRNPKPSDMRGAAAMCIFDIKFVHIRHAPTHPAGVLPALFAGFCRGLGTMAWPFGQDAFVCQSS